MKKLDPLDPLRETIAKLYELGVIDRRHLLTMRRRIGLAAKLIDEGSDPRPVVLVVAACITMLRELAVEMSTQGRKYSRARIRVAARKVGSNRKAIARELGSKTPRGLYKAKKKGNF